MDCLDLLQVKVWLCLVFYKLGVNCLASRRETDMQWKLIGKEKHFFHWHSDFYSVSKRRVPNGPDPIHNRHWGKILTTLVHKLEIIDIGELRILDNHQFECKQIKKDISAGEEDDQK
ncbi:CLAVATA3/ESR (CLE)-related protein 25 [Cucumis melo var. makuwa]|uniref:CLAVATA3/ESR (CLE)-related protein 25 n=1 Tax=Cucumis melo var. makuwa TaxID=1194695 RepID=A0A5A7T759_CUCMM|nr:CLAVATA3/ESR (CLE)-related protein 25 [Cucumis melo var. makuwa]TYK00212.1 CLAVATA3/ESR (CLE)-related protein 25 [Cucumis melo var. makuwa]